MNILIDADALVALSKQDDSNHQKALKIAKKIVSSRVFISPYTIPEAVTVISHRLSQKDAKKFLHESRKKAITILSLSSDVEKSADEFFDKQYSKGTSWPDCLNMALCKKYSLDAIFSFDEVYKKNGFKLIT